MPPQLLALNEGPSILLDKPILLVGRHQECDIQLPSRKVSRRHCCIAQVNDHLVVRDLCSTNGIRINGVRVLEGCLRAGDELTIGNYRYQVRWNALPGDLSRSSRAPVSPEEQRRLPRRPTALDDDSDDPLESAEEPIPLAEPGIPSSPLPVRKRPVPVVPPAARPPGQALPPPPSNPLVLPENLQLAPASDVFPSSGEHPKPSP